MRIFTISTAIVFMLSVIDGRQNGRKRDRTNNDMKNAGSKRKEQNSKTHSSYMNAFLQAIDSNDRDLPIFCSEDELSRAIRRCVLIWKNYCKCKHCAYCTENEWPPAETEMWGSRRAGTDWKDLEDAWKWAGKCAYNKTNLWRISCNELQGMGTTTDEKTGERKEYEYWFLVNLEHKTNQSFVQELCLKKECPHLLTAQQYEVQKTSEQKITTTAKVTATPAEDYENNFDEKVLECKEKELNTMMTKCMLIWKEYCRCAGCRDVPACDKKEWPPRQTSKWSSRKLTNDLIKLDSAWKWVGECAFNATAGWRDWCYIRSPGIDDQDDHEPEYWFLTELNANTHPKMIQGLCETSECHKFKETSKLTTPMPNTAETTIQMQDSTSIRIQTNAKKKPSTTGAEKTTTTIGLSFTKSQPSGVIVPKWAYIIIAVLGLIVIVMIALLVLFFYYRAKTKRRNSQQSKLERRGTTSTVTSAPWQHQTSFTFFGEQPLPGVEDSIYHTIRDVQPSAPPASPSFFPSFAPQTCSFKEPKSESRPNVLYHDTTPRYQNSFIQRGDSSKNDTHTYEDTRPFSPPPVLPYFIPTGAEQTNEYGTLEEPTKLEGTSRETSASQRRKNQQHKGNYDHIELI